MQRITFFLLTIILAGTIGLAEARAQGLWMTRILEDMAGTSAPADEGKSPEAGSPQTDNQGPVDWGMFCQTENQLFPSVVITMATMQSNGYDEDEYSFGSPLSMVTVYMQGRAAGDRATVEISSTSIIRPSRMEVVLADPNETYQISPHLKYDYEKLLSIRQAYPEDITAKVYLNGEFIGEKTQTLVVRSLNDCFFGVLDEDGTFNDFRLMFAAYVNEGDPLIDEILGEALKKGYVDAFVGYQSDMQMVLYQVAAIWRVLQDRGIRYSSITTTSVASDTILSQHVRLVGDSTRGSQANCADGSVLFASIFRKIGLNAFLVVLPGHMMVGVGTDSNNSQAAYIETTMLADASLSEAMQSAEATMGKTESSQILVIDINQARQKGFLPLRDVN